MNRQSESVLEFPTLLAILDRYARTPAGHARVRGLTPGRDRAALEVALQLAREAAEHLRAAAAGQRGVLKLDFYGIADVEPVVRRLCIEGAVLEPLEIADILLLLDRAVDFKQIFSGLRERFPSLAALAGRVGEFRTLLREMSGKIRPDGTLDDHASPALHRLRREIEKQKTAIQESLQRFFRQHGEEGVLQEELVTIRNDRYVVPVKAGMKRRIEGVVHGASSSGQTVFVEPLETIALNNELVGLREKELQEEFRILSEMTARLRERVEEIQTALEVVGELDLAFAKGAFAADFDCTIPRFVSSGTDDTRRLRLKEARHPVLEDVLRARKASVVPLSLELDEKNRVLVMSGPNTGGKTVALKTVGLLALAAQAGIPIPAAEAELVLFDQVLADIGDYQSIEANLSTFSAHLTNIESMVETVTPNSLVLLDELGAATDPAEGGALAVAIVEFFLKSGAFTIASTHHLALKAYATNMPGVLNAAVGFDEQTLQPTYRLLLGVPGKSSGIDIAQRLGLKPQILERARRALTSQDEEVGRLLARLHASVEEAERMREEARRLEQELRERTGQLAAQWEKRERAKLAELEKRLSAVIAKVEEEARAAIQQISDKHARREAERRVARMRRETHEEFNAAVLEELGVPSETPPAEPAEIREGMSVRLRGLGRTGVVRRKLDEDLFEVEVGLLKMHVPASELEPAAPPKEQAVRVSVGVQPESVPTEINVIGCTAEEARGLVDKFLDTAVLASVPRVRVIHGHGKGILRKALKEMFETHPHVERFYTPEQQEGGAGATIVELRV